MIMTLKKFWDGLSPSQRFVIIRKFHFWGGLSDFRYQDLPEDLKPILKREMERKQAQMGN